MELVSEIQRKFFKDRPENKGKPHGGGLFGLATNVNYGGYTLWRAGCACAASGPVWGVATGALMILRRG
jgi:steroid 5-alpha reductase family enzyme